MLVGGGGDAVGPISPWCWPRLDDRYQFRERVAGWDRSEECSDRLLLHREICGGVRAGRRAAGQTRRRRSALRENGARYERRRQQQLRGFRHVANPFTLGPSRYVEPVRGPQRYNVVRKSAGIIGT